MVEFKIAKGGRPTGKMIAGMLQARGIELNIRAFGRKNKGEPGGDAVINWGISGSDNRPTLNAKANGSKYEQLKKLEAKYVLCPATARFDGPFKLQYPVLARRDRHAGGTDILLINGPEDYRRIPNDYAYTTQLVPSTREFRVWIFRDRHLVTYEKIKKREAEQPGFGRNYAQGYGFDRIENEAVPNALKQIGRDAIRALELDFGAIDILLGTDGRYYVLEVNTAPRIENERRTCGLRLVKQIEKWVQAGYPARGEAQ